MCSERSRALDFRRGFCRLLCVWIKLMTACLILPLAAAQQPATTQAARIEYRERHLGPFNLEGRSYHLVLREAGVSGGQPVNSDFDRTVADIWLRDAEGRDLFHRRVPVRQRGQELEESVSVTAHSIQGREGAGLLLTYHTLPSAPLGGESWQVFGVRANKLEPMSNRIVTAGKLDVSLQNGVVRPAWNTDLSSDTIRLKVWTGFCFVLIPLKLDWKRAVAVPTTACGPLQRGRTSCQFPIELQLQPPVAGKSVKLYPTPARGDGRATVVTISPTAEVEILKAKVALAVTEIEDDLLLSVVDDLWLSVCVDGVTAWVQGWEDLTALGLPPAG